MKMIATALTGFIVCFLSASPTWAQAPTPADVAGKWQLITESPRGTQTAIITFEQQGNTLSGTVETRLGSSPINSGSVDGHVVTFTVLRGVGSRGMAMTYTGTLEGDTIRGSMTTPRGDRPFTMRRVEG